MARDKPNLAHRRTHEKLFPPERQLTKANQPSLNLEGGVQGQI